MEKAPLIGIRRHRISTDGEGVTTLVAFHGCPLRCTYCLNRQCLEADGVWREMTTAQLLDEVSVDSLYFLATGGGITFGGGEPCLRSKFIEEFCQLADSRWHITLETSLNVERHHLERLVPVVGQWIVDIKDMDDDIYHRYTQRDAGRARDNLRWLLSDSDRAGRTIIRLPLIPDFNTPDDIRRSRAQLEAMGATHFDEFEYRTTFQV